MGHTSSFAERCVQRHLRFTIKVEEVLTLAGPNMHELEAVRQTSGSLKERNEIQMTGCEHPSMPGHDCYSIGALRRMHDGESVCVHAGRSEHHPVEDSCMIDI